MAHDIFLCYARSDREIADRVAAMLRERGWRVFQDVNTHVGRRWHREIERELHAARAVVVLWSAASRDSDYVLEEADYGKRKEILFPAFIEQVEFPYGFGRIQTADLIGWGGEDGHGGVAQLVGPLALHLDDDVDEAPPPTELPAPPEAPAVHAPGTTFRDRLADGGDGPLMVVIPAGRFMMGSPPEELERGDSEGPQHEVCIAKPFAMGVHAVTFDDYECFARATGVAMPGDEGWGRGSRPVINISWDDAQAYCSWLSAKSGETYRLPSEAEWEYACRAGTSTPFYFGECLSTEQANFDGNITYNGSAKGEYREKTMPVGSFPANAFGLYEMHGNVWEWCQDHWHDDYVGAPADGSAWESGDDKSRELRGGSWGSDPWNCRAAGRNAFRPDARRSFIGFRVCRSSPIV